MRIISLSTGSLYHLGLARIFSIAKRAGFSSLELMMRSSGESGYYDTYDFKYVKDLEREFGIKVTSLHSPVDFEFRPEYYLPIVVEMAKRIEVRHIIVHLPKTDEKYLSYRQWFSNFEREALSADQSIPILVENMGRECVYRSKLEYLRYHDFCFDIAHEIKTDNDLSEISQMPNIRQFHVSDCLNGKSHYSILDRSEYFSGILSGKAGDFCLELSPEAFGKSSDEGEIIELLSKNRAFLESIRD